jgi:signal transduction histidine kinase
LTLSENDVASPPFAWYRPRVRADADIHHTVAFYDDDAAVMESTATFLASALRDGHPAVVIATPDHRARLADELTAEGLALPALTERGQYVALDAREVLSQFCDGRSVNRVRFVELVGGVISQIQSVTPANPRVAAFGEMVGLLCEDGHPQLAADLEDCWNALAQTHDFSLHCAYPMRLFQDSGAAETLSTTCEAHQWVVPTEAYTNLDTERSRLLEVTRLQQRSLALEAALEERQRVVENRERFLAVAAHELRTPVTVIKGAADVLAIIAHKLDSGTTSLLPLIEILTNGASRLVELCDTLLECAVSGQFIVGPMSEKVELTEVIDAAIEDIQAASQGSHGFTRNFGEARITIPASREQLLVVVRNLLDNAVKYSAAGSLVTVHHSQVGNAIVLEVEDEGIGIPQDAGDSLFDPFVRGDNALAADTSGRGIGLHVCRSIIEEHGGTIQLHPRADRMGTVARITLPIG